VVVEHGAKWRFADTGKIVGVQVVASVFVVRDGRVSHVMRYPDLADASGAVNLGGWHEARPGWIPKGDAFTAEGGHDG
jgi:hypothetical protein